MSGHRADYRRLREGCCPLHGTQLDRRADHGWCEECGTGWSLTPDAVNLHIEIDASEFRTSHGTIRSGPGSVRFIRPLDDDE